MLKLAQTLIRDFQNNLGDPLFMQDVALACSQQNVLLVRHLLDSIAPNGTVAQFKATYQIKSVFKRFRFSNDLYTNDQLETQAIQKFLENQERLKCLNVVDLPKYMEAIVVRARKIVASVLGPYDDEECRDLSQFGSRASVGVPLSKACEAERWVVPISGSLDQAMWFSEEIMRSELVYKYLDAQPAGPNGSLFHIVQSLKLTLVPKTFKSLRVIMPNTTIGSYCSMGVGKMIRKRLATIGLNMSSLQKRHRVLARVASRDNTYVTADLSMASDSITGALLKRLLPEDWFSVLTKLRIGKVQIGNSTTDMETFCTMGIGYTFPLQMLIFYSLLRAIDQYFFIDSSLISVYGDDLIYSKRLHFAVVDVFPRMGFLLNEDKSFPDGPFRESCGGDYYLGWDVRPFQPEGVELSVCEKTYESFLYKSINGLLQRWSEEEIPLTLRFLGLELMTVTQSIKRVPAHFAEDSGVQCPTLQSHSFLCDFKLTPVKHLGNGLISFRYLGLKAQDREETRHEPFMWRQLSGDNNSGYNHSQSSYRYLPASHVMNRINDSCGVSKCSTQQFINVDVGTKVRSSLGRYPWKWDRTFHVKDDVSCLIHDYFVPSGWERVFFPRLERTQTRIRITGAGVYTRKSGISCFEVRRGA